MRVLSQPRFADSILRISFVAPTPSSFGIDMSRSTMLMFDRQWKEQGTADKNALKSTLGLEQPNAIKSVNGSNCIISLISDGQDQWSRKVWSRQQAQTLVLSHFILRKRRSVRLNLPCQVSETLTTDREEYGYPRRREPVPSTWRNRRCQWRISIVGRLFQQRRLDCYAHPNREKGF